MPRFKTPDAGLKLIPVDFERQVLPGTFAQTGFSYSLVRPPSHWANFNI